MDIDKMTVAEFARESEGNPLMQGHIWTKAYEMESRIKELEGVLDKCGSWLCGEKLDLKTHDLVFEMKKLIPTSEVHE